MGSGCVSVSLSDSARYPYFTRMTPSFRFNVPCHGWASFCKHMIPWWTSQDVKKLLGVLPGDDHQWPLFKSSVASCTICFTIITIVLVNLKSAHGPQVLSIYELFKFFGYRRIGIVYGYRSTNSLAKDLLLEMMANDNAAGTYSWTPLFNHRVEFIADAQAAIDLAASKDSRTVLECLGMLAFAF